MSENGISNLEALLQSDDKKLNSIPGVGSVRSRTWIESASKLIENGVSAYQYREEEENGLEPRVPTSSRDGNIDSYVRRRARELSVVKRDDGSYLVRGGLDEHIVTACKMCDCPKGTSSKRCKHVLAVEVFESQTVPTKISSSRKTASKSHSKRTCLDLEKLWLC